MVKNIILFNDFAHVNGGAAQVCIQSALGLKERGYHVVLFSATNEIDQRLKDHGIQVVQTHQYDILSNPSKVCASIQGIWNRKAQKVLEAEILDKYEPSDTVIHIHGYIKALSPSIFSTLSKYKFPVAITLHDYFLACPNGGFYNYQSQHICDYSPLSRTCVCSNCDVRNYPQKLWRVFRQYIQRSAINKLPKLWLFSISDLTERQIKACPPMRDTSKITYMRVENPIELPESLSAEPSLDGHYLFMARLSHEKGIDLFCKAITDLGLKGLVLGDGYLREYYERAYPQIEFKGWVKGEEKKTLMRRCKCLLFCSLWYEGLGLSVLESQSYGLPCIVPDRCSASELVVDGENGFIFESGNLDSLKEAIVRLEKADYSRLYHRTLEMWDSNKHSIDAHVDRLEEVYNLMLNNKGIYEKL